MIDHRTRSRQQLPVEGWNGKNVETSPCFKTPLKAECRQSVIGCRSLCKALDQGWIGASCLSIFQTSAPSSKPDHDPCIDAIYNSTGYYIDNVEGDRNLVDPMMTRPTGEKIRWSQQFLQGRTSCGST